MNAAVRDRFGPPEVVEVRELEAPAPADSLRYLGDGHARGKVVVTV